MIITYPSSHHPILLAPTPSYPDADDTATTTTAANGSDAMVVESFDSPLAPTSAEVTITASPILLQSSANVSSQAGVTEPSSQTRETAFDARSWSSLCRMASSSGGAHASVKPTAALQTVRTASLKRSLPGDNTDVFNVNDSTTVANKRPCTSDSSRAAALNDAITDSTSSSALVPPPTSTTTPPTTSVSVEVVTEAAHPPTLMDVDNDVGATTSTISAESSPPSSFAASTDDGLTTSTPCGDVSMSTSTNSPFLSPPSVSVFSIPPPPPPSDAAVVVTVPHTDAAPDAVMTLVSALPPLSPTTLLTPLPTAEDDAAPTPITGAAALTSSMQVDEITTTTTAPANTAGTVEATAAPLLTTPVPSTQAASTALRVPQHNVPPGFGILKIRVPLAVSGRPTIIGFGQSGPVYAAIATATATATATAAAPLITTTPAAPEVGGAGALMLAVTPFPYPPHRFGIPTRSLALPAAAMPTAPKPKAKRGKAAAAAPVLQGLPPLSPRHVEIFADARFSPLHQRLRVAQVISRAVNAGHTKFERLGCCPLCENTFPSAAQDRHLNTHADQKPLIPIMKALFTAFKQADAVAAAATARAAAASAVSAAAAAAEAAAGPLLLLSAAHAAIFAEARFSKLELRAAQKISREVNAGKTNFSDCGCCPLCEGAYAPNGTVKLDYHLSSMQHSVHKKFIPLLKDLFEAFKASTK